MAVIVNGDGILTGISSLATALTDITSGRGTITGVTTVGTLQLGAGVSISSPRTQTAAIFTNNTEFFTVDDAGRVGVGTITPNSDAHPENEKKINVGFITARSIAGDIDANTMVVAGVSTFVGAINGTLATAAQANVTSLGTLTGLAVNGNITLSDSIIHLGDTDTKIQFPSNDTISFTTNSTEKVRIDSGGRLLIGTATVKSAGAGQYAKLNVEGYVGGNECFASFSRAEAASAMSSGDEVANLTFNDSAGYEFARIQVLADAATGATDTPGRIVFRTTADGASSSTERLRINSLGQISIRGTTTAFDTTGDLDALQLYYETDSGQASIGPYSSGGNTYLSFYTNSGGAAATEKVRIAHGGYVNILDGGLTCTDTGAGSGTSNLELQPYGTDGYINCTASGNLYTRMGSGYAIRTKIDSSGNFHINSGNIVMTTAGKGIDFSATSDGSGTSINELLDDYEEGSFTLTATPDSGSIAFNSSYNQGTYTKVGNICHIQAYLSVSSNNSGTGVLELNSLPFTVYDGADASGHVRAHSIVYLNANSPVDGNGYYTAQLYANEGNTWIRLYEVSNTGKRDGDISHHFGPGGDIFLQFTYFAA